MHIYHGPVNDEEEKYGENRLAVEPLLSFFSSLRCADTDCAVAYNCDPRMAMTKVWHYSARDDHRYTEENCFRITDQALFDDFSRARIVVERWMKNHHPSPARSADNEDERERLQVVAEMVEGTGGNLWMVGHHRVASV